jgi:hypothetical protein
MAEAAKTLIQQHYSDEIPVEIDVVQEPDNIVIGTASGIMYEN